MTRPAHPVSIAIAPRPWLTRNPGECAFPVAGEGVATLACCNPCGGRTYCAAHADAVRGPPARSAEQYEASILKWLEEGR
jgi:hypothetical protein